MPRERMPETPEGIREDAVRGRINNVIDMQSRQSQEQQWAIEEIDRRGITGPERTNAVNAVNRDISKRLFPEQTTSIMPTDIGAERAARRGAMPGTRRAETQQEITRGDLEAQRNAVLHQLALSDAPPEKMREVFEQYQEQLDALTERGVIKPGDIIPNDQVADIDEIDPKTGKLIEMETVLIETELGEREIKIPKSIEQKVKLVRQALALSERNVEGEGTAGVQQAAKIAQTIIAATQDPRYKQRNHIYKEGAPHDPTNKENIDDVKEKKRDDLLNRLYNEYAARTYLNQTYQAYEKADDAAKVSGALSGMRFEWMNTLFRDVPELKFLLQYYVDHGTEFSEKKDPITGKDNKKEFQEKARAYATEKERGEKMRKQYSEIVLGGDVPPEDISKFEAKDMEWAQNLAERVWQMLGRRGSQDRVSGFFEDEGSKEWGDDPQGGNLVLRKVLRWKDWVIYQKGALRPHIELMDGIDLDQNDFVTQIAGQIDSSPKNKENIKKQNKKIIEAFRAKKWMDVEVVISKMKPEDRNDEAKIIEAVEKTHPHILEELFKDDKYKSLVIENEEEDPNDKKKKIKKYQANTLVRDVVIAGAQGRVKAIRNGKEEMITVDASVKAQSVNFEEVDWDEFDFRIFGTNPMAYWSYRNIQQPDAARDALIKGSETFLRMPNDQTIKAAADSLSYLSAKQWDQKTNIVVRYLEFLQSDGAREAFQDKIPNNEDRERILHESTIALLDSLKLGLPEYEEIREKVIGKQPWAELELALSYLRPRRSTFNAMNGLFEEIGKAVYKDLKVA